MAARKKNEEVLTVSFSASLPQYQVDAIYETMERENYRSQSAVVSAAIDSFLGLTRPQEFIEIPKPKSKK